MSDYRDPRDPIRRDPLYDGLNDPALNQMRAQAVGPGMALAWFLGLVLFIGVLIFAFGGSDNPRVAGTETGQPAPAGETRTGPEPTPAPSTTPPANTPATPAPPAKSPPAQ
ncbi:MAG: hypothetical protein WD207_11900 [Xanthobacteraceae bacterium]